MAANASHISAFCRIIDKKRFTAKANSANSVLTLSTAKTIYMIQIYIEICTLCIYVENYVNLKRILSIREGGELGVS